MNTSCSFTGHCHAPQASKEKLRARLLAAPPELKAEVASSDFTRQYLIFLTLINPQVPHQLLQLQHLKRCDVQSRP